jgi:hypothetical protein
MAKVIKKKETVSEPYQFLGLLRGVSDIKEIIPTTTPEGKKSGIVYYAELLMDNGRTYRHSSFQKPYLENFKDFIDKEIEGLVTPRGEFESIDFKSLPVEYTDKYPRQEVKTAPKAPPTKPATSDSYWRDKAERDVETNKAIEQQFYISEACKFYLALGRVTDANCEDVLENGMAKGVELYHKYGRTSK